MPDPADHSPPAPAGRRARRLGALSAAALAAFASMAAAQGIAERAAQRPPEASLIDIRELVGAWRVTGVSVLPARVQAFARNDPAYLGRTMLVTMQQLTWADSARPGAATLDDRCEGPATARLPRAGAGTIAATYRAALSELGVTQPATVNNPHEVACLQAGTWGPAAQGGALLFPISTAAFALTWYDGVVLRLERAR